MADVPGKFYRATKVRTGVSPSSPGVIEGETLPPLNPPGGSLNSVGLTMPSAFNVANSPLTSNGTLAVTGAGTVGQYIRGDGSLADFPQASGGGSSVSYYLNGSVDQGTIGGVAYRELSKVPILGAGTDFTINADGYIASFITDAGDPNLLEIPGGNWNFETYFSASSSGGTPTFYVELYKVSGTTATLIASSSSAPELIAFGTNLTPYYSTLAVPTTTLALTDRLAIRYYVTHSGRTITMHTENNHLCQIITTFTTGLTALNGLTAQVQNFSVGTSGTDFNIASATATHTFNLPTASATNRGALSSADWSLFRQAYNDKINSASVTGTTTKTLTLVQQDGGEIQASWSDLNTDAVTSVFGRTGAVVAVSGDYNTSQVTESGNLYFTQARVSANTDVASNTAARHNAVTLGTANGLSLSTQQLSLGLASGSATGALSAADWNTFNSKQNALTLTTTGSSGVATLLGSILNIPNYGSALSGYVPYTGATSNVDLGIYTLSSSNLIANGGFNSGALFLKQSNNAQTINLDYTTITPIGTNQLNFGFSQSSGVWKSFVLNAINLTNNTNRTYTLPDASGTIALVGGSGVGTVTSVAALTLGTSGTDLSSTVANSTTTPVITLNVPTASATNRGALSAADWTTFNNKQNALTNPVTGTGVNGRVAFWNGTNSITSDADLLFNGSELNVSGIKIDGSFIPYIISTLAGSDLNIQFPVGQGLSINNNGAENIARISKNNFSLIGASTIQTSTGNMTISTGGGNGNIILSPNGSGTTTINSNVTASSFIRSGGTSGQFLKADGSVDSNTYYLASNPSAFIALTALSGVAPIQYNNTTGAISITQASGSTNGFLSSTDWTTFNNKQNALTNPVTGTGTTNYLPKFTGSTTIGNSSLNDDGTSVGVGIALTSNVGNLQVGGTANTSLFAQQGTDTVRMGVRASGRTGISFDSSNATFTNRMWYIDNVGANGSLTIGRSGLDVLTFSNSGNLGLGVTPSAWWSGFKAIQYGTTGILASGSGVTNVGHNYYFDGTNVIYLTSTNASFYQQTVGEHRFFTAPSGTAGNAISFTQAMTLFATGNLLVGTPSPISDNGARLQVSGAATFSSSVQATNMSIGIAPQTDKLFVYNASGTNTGLTIQQDGTGEIFRANGNGGANRLVIQQGGNVGIGTTSPASTRLAVRSFTGGTDAGESVISATLGDNSTITNALLTIRNAGNRGNIGNANGSSLFRAEFNDATAMIINKDGFVGIGTPSPQSPIDVISPTNGYVSFGRNISVGQWTGIHFGYREDNTLYRKSAIVFERTGGAAQGNIHFLNNNANDITSASLSDSRMTITSSGNVGIGTPGPSQLLHLYTNLATSSGVGTAMQITSDGAGGDNAWIGVNKGSGNGLEFSVENRDIIFNTGATTPFGGTERMRIFSGGNVRIGGSSVGDNGNLLRVDGQVFINANTQFDSKTTTGVASSNVAIANFSNAEGSTYYITATDGTNYYRAILLGIQNSITVVSSLTTGTVPSRSFVISSNILNMSFTSGTWTVKCTQIRTV